MVIIKDFYAATGVLYKPTAVRVKRENEFCTKIISWTPKTLYVTIRSLRFDFDKETVLKIKYTGEIDAQKFTFVKDFTPWCLKTLVGSNNIDLKVRFVSMPGLYGEMEEYDRWTYDVKIKKGSDIMTTLSTIAHECVHIKQTYSGEWTYNEKKDIHTFRRKKYPGEITEDVKYWLSPWEVEAFGMEYGLVRAWMDERKYDTKTVSWFKSPAYVAKKRKKVKS
jgi:hypothetical protein